ncbi:MAG TPA: 4Fe-4S dicluster domain-containing protein [Thermoplasmata archaeon]|nr:4Fe-4S dicluster domain-containing protein [Thermoplasmata archaeon]HUJ77634.1 4Fe-4S dicluster domain-containing protein [Thermoplasmata archaeon]
MPAKIDLASRLGANAYASDKTSHLSLSDPALCRECVLKPCIPVCPAEVYHWESTADKLLIRYENCLELGACRIACHEIGRRALVWSFPAGSRGVQYRYG